MCRPRADRPQSGHGQPADRLDLAACAGIAFRTDDDPRALGGCRLCGGAGGDVLHPVSARRPRDGGGGGRAVGDEQRRSGIGAAQNHHSGGRADPAGRNADPRRSHRLGTGLRLHLRCRHGDVGRHLHPPPGGGDQVRVTGVTGHDGRRNRGVHRPRDLRPLRLRQRAPADLHLVSHGHRSHHRVGRRRDGFQPDPRPRPAGAGQGRSGAVRGGSGAGGRSTTGGDRRQGRLPGGNEP